MSNLNKDLDGKYLDSIFLISFLLNIGVSGIDAFMMNMASENKGKQYEENMKDMDTLPVRQNKKGVTMPPRRPASGIPSGPGSGKKTKTLGRGASPGKLDKIHDLERENTTLKTKENLLSSEIGKMKTKLRRLEEMMKKRGNPSNESMIPADV